MMRNMVGRIRWALFWCGLWSVGWAQHEFVQFTYYDQLTWSPDGQQLAFRCILLDESQPERLRINVLVKDLARDRLFCLDPQPEHFVVAQNKKQLLFSSSYGLYLMSLDPPSAPVQIYFRDPTTPWYFQEFGFLKKNSGIYVDRYEPATDKVVRHYFRLPAVRAAAATFDWAEATPVSKIRGAAFNLPQDGPNVEPTARVKLKQAAIQFVAKSQPGSYDLVFQPSGIRAQAATVLLKDVRPRLLSANPRQTDVILSVFAATGHKTFHFATQSGQLAPIDSSRYYTLAWLDDQRYLCVTDQGLILRSIDRSLDQKLNNWPLPTWCQSISLALPQYELQVGFEPDRPSAEKISSQLAKMGYFARLKYHQAQNKAGYRIRVGGFFTRSEAQQFAIRLKRQGFNYWIVPIDDWYDFFNASRASERRSFNDSAEAMIEYKFDRYLRSRIVLKAPNKPDRVIVDEMNNIPGRGKW